MRLVSRLTSHVSRFGVVFWSMTFPALLAAQATGAEPPRSTREGVYNQQQADQGRDLYSLNCQSCHSAGSHTAPGFTLKWRGRSLGELYGYVRSSMPKSDPGSLTQREYVLVLAYLLKLNGVPAGAAELPADSVALSRIRIDWRMGDTTQQR